MRPIIHPGFGQSGTTSLQMQLFSRRPDLFYCGYPFGNLGGIFSWIKYQDECDFDANEAQRLCQSYIFSRLKPGQRVVVSDETLTEQPEIYFTPPMMPLPTIVSRLKTIFPEAMVVFMIRNQFDYATSMYLNLKRNFVKFNLRPIEAFDSWFDGQFSQISNLYLRNLNYRKAISAYAKQFGRASISVLPLEMIKHEGQHAYLQKLSRDLEISISAEDEEAHAKIINRRLTVTENAIFNWLPNSAFRAALSQIERVPGAGALIERLKNAPPMTIKLNENVVARIRQLACEANRWIEKEFRVPLTAYGYPV